MCLEGALLLSPLPFSSEFGKIPGIVSLGPYVIPFVGTFLEGVLCWRLAVRRSLCRWPYFSIFVFYTFFRDVALFQVSRYEPRWFPAFYWRGETLSLFLRFLVIWEFFRGLFPARSTLHDLAWKVLLAVGVVMLPVVFLLFWGQMSQAHTPYVHFSPLFEQYLSLMQVLLLLAPAAVARYYELPLGRYMWGLGFGFGAYLAVCSIDFAGLQVSAGFFPYWHLLSPITFICMILMWLWAFWNAAPAVPGSESVASGKQKPANASADSDSRC